MRVRSAGTRCSRSIGSWSVRICASPSGGCSGRSGCSPCSASSRSLVWDWLGCALRRYGRLRGRKRRCGARPAVRRPGCRPAARGEHRRHRQSRRRAARQRIVDAQQALPHRRLPFADGAGDPAADRAARAPSIRTHQRVRGRDQLGDPARHAGTDCAPAPGRAAGAGAPLQKFVNQLVIKSRKAPAHN